MRNASYPQPINSDYIRKLKLYQQRLADMPVPFLEWCSFAVNKIHCPCKIPRMGNLKQINALWKFKAIGYDDNGDVIPGGGPLTEHHNVTFETSDAAAISAKLLFS